MSNQTSLSVQIPFLHKCRQLLQPSRILSQRQTNAVSANESNREYESISEASTGASVLQVQTLGSLSSSSKGSTYSSYTNISSNISDKKAVTINSEYLQYEVDQVEAQATR